MLTMNLSHEYLLKSRQLTWENAEVIDHLFGPVALGVKNENWKDLYKNRTGDSCINEPYPTQRVCQRGYEETKKKMHIHLDYNEMISVRVLVPPIDLNINIKPPSRYESISFTEGDPPTVANQSERAHGDDKNASTICHKQFTRKTQLTRHHRTHTGGKPFSCPQCGRNFTQRGNLKIHLRVHSGIKEFSCDICHKEFSHKSNLKRHRRNHNGDKPFKCNECNAMFSQQSHLTRHRRPHTGDKPFKCSECNAMFSQRSDLNVHMTTHTGETPYQCEICERKFAQLSTLKSHLLIHSEEKPFACKYANCSKAFRQKGDLQRHIRVHTKDKPYACPKCHKMFSQSGSCMRHAEQCSVTKNVSSDDSKHEGCKL